MTDNLSRKLARDAQKLLDKIANEKAIDNVVDELKQSIADFKTSWK